MQVKRWISEHVQARWLLHALNRRRDGCCMRCCNWSNSPVVSISPHWSISIPPTCSSPPVVSNSAWHEVHSTAYRTTYLAPLVRCLHGLLSHCCSHCSDGHSNQHLPSSQRRVRSHLIHLRPLSMLLTLIITSIDSILYNLTVSNDITLMLIHLRYGRMSVRYWYYRYTYCNGCTIHSRNVNLYSLILLLL
jgi:hypothetical protein